MVEIENSFRVYVWIVGVLAIVFLVNKWRGDSNPNLDHIPVVGPTGKLGSLLLAAYKFFINGHSMIQEGVEKYNTAMFRVWTMNRWTVIVNDPRLIEDIRQARDEELSFRHAVDDILQVKYAVGPEVAENHYHVEVVRSALTRNLAARFADVRDEIVSAFNDMVPLNGNEWTAVPALETMQQIVCRTSNRLFVGLPLCRDPDYCDLNIKFAVEVFMVGPILNLFPRILHPLIGPLLSPTPRTLRRASKTLGALIEQRLKEEAEQNTNRPDKPNDLISWLMDVAPEPERNLRMYMIRALVVNSAAIHTTSNSFTQTLFYLASHPEYIPPLREEVETIIQQEGWTKAAIDKMHKTDSFIREVLRLAGIIGLTMGRRVVKPSGFTFSDGTHIPQGATVAVSTWAVHHRTGKYTNPDEFDGFRFSDIREDSGGGGGLGSKHQLVSTTVEHVTFGHGRHACPGRFFAANELKAMLAHVLLNYDVRLEDDKLPVGSRLGATLVPDQKARVLFRKRQG